MGLKREVMYLDADQITKLDKVQSRFGFGNKSEAVRFVIDSVDPTTIEDNAELALWSKLLRESVTQAEQTLEGTMAQIAETDRYFSELRLAREKP